MHDVIHQAIRNMRKLNVCRKKNFNKGFRSVSEQYMFTRQRVLSREPQNTENLLNNNLRLNEIE